VVGKESFRLSRSKSAQAFLAPSPSTRAEATRMSLFARSLE
jgi:hypothetical protein